MGLAQHPFIPKDAKEWSEEDISNIEKTLHSHIQLINFYVISSEDFFYKVLPHKKLLPKETEYNITELHMVQSKKSNINGMPPSILIERRNFSSFSPASCSPSRCAGIDGFKLIYFLNMAKYIIYLFLEFNCLLIFISFLFIYYK